MVMDPAVFDAMGIETMDVSLSTLPGVLGQGNLGFTPSASVATIRSSAVRSTDQERPCASRRAPRTTFLRNPNDADGQWWLTNIFRAPGLGLLGFVHVEKSAASDSVSTGPCLLDQLRGLVDVSRSHHRPILRPGEANITGTPYLIKDGISTSTSAT